MEARAPRPSSAAAARLAGLIGSAADAGYPLRREGGDYAVWAVIGGEDAPLQRVLEATSTAEQLLRRAPRAR